MASLLPVNRSGVFSFEQSFNFVVPSVFGLPNGEQPPSGHRELPSSIGGSGWPFFGRLEYYGKRVLLKNFLCPIEQPIRHSARIPLEAQFAHDLQADCPIAYKAALLFYENVLGPNIRV